LADIGERVRTLRTRKELTLEQVAHACGCSASFVSQIERNKVSPSLSTLKRMANALEVQMADFFAEPHENSHVVTRVDERIALTLPRWKSNMNLLVRSSRDKNMQPFYTEIDPGGGALGEYTHEGEEFGIVLEGELELRLDDDVYRLSAGESFYYSSRHPHSWVNCGSKKTVVIWVVSPPTF